LRPEVLSSLLHDVYMMASSQRSVATATAAAAVMRQRWFQPVSHELNMFNLCDSQCNCRNDYTNWSQSHRPAKWCDTGNVEETV